MTQTTSHRSHDPADLIGKRVTWCNGRGLAMTVIGNSVIQVLDDEGVTCRVYASLLDIEDPSPRVDLLLGEVSVLQAALRALRLAGDRRVDAQGYARLQRKLDRLGAIAFGIEREQDAIDEAHERAIGMNEEYDRMDRATRGVLGQGTGRPRS